MQLGGFVTPAIRNLVIACTAVFLVQTLFNLFSRTAYVVMLREFGLVPHLFTHGLRVWQPFTYLFLHGGLWHLLFNMLALWMFGCDIERSWGRRRFYNYFFLTGIGAGLINVLVKTVMDPRGLSSAAIPTIGASGAIYGILLAAAILFPDRRIWLIPFPVMIPMRIYVLGMGAVSFFFNAGSRRRQRQPRQPPGRHVGGLPVPAAGHLVLPRAERPFGLEAPPRAAQVRGLYAQAPRGAAFASRPLGSLSQDPRV